MISSLQDYRWHMLQQHEMTMTHRLRISQSGVRFKTPLSAKCWVNKCPSNGDLSPILVRLKRMSVKRELCSYLLTHVRGNNIIEDQPSLFVYINEWLAYTF